MILYVCPKCGKWADVRFGQYLKDSWNKAFSDQPSKQMPLTYPCESGCGLMIQIQPTDRIFVQNKQSPSVAAAEDYGKSLLRTYGIVGITPLEE